MTPLAPEPILRAALYVVHVAAYTTRNWTYREGWPRPPLALATAIQNGQEIRDRSGPNPGR